MGGRWAGCGFVVCAAVIGSASGVNKKCAFNSTLQPPNIVSVSPTCVSTPACRGPDPGPTCPLHCTEIPDDAGTFLGARMEVQVDVVVLTNGTNKVATGTTFVDARFGVVTPSELASLTLTPVGAADEIHGNTNTTFTVEVSYTPIKAVYDRTALDAANTKLSCFNHPSPPPSPFTQPPPTTYSAVFWAPGVDPFPPGSTAFSNFSLGGCPAPGTATDATAYPGVELFSCFPADPRLETCTELRRCTVLERQSNAATRTKTQNVECETLTTCDSGARFQVAAPTATTDRVCVDRVETCSLDAGQITADPGTLTTASTCADVEPCGADGADGADKKYTATGATSVTQPVCLDVKTCGDVGVEFESAAPELEKDRACSRVLAACDSTPTVVEAVRNTLSDGVVPTPVDFYESAAATATTDRVCTPATVCLQHETLDAQLTPTTDRTCRTRDACSGTGTGSSCAPPGAPPGPPSSPPPDGLAALIWGSVSLVVGTVWVVNVNIASGNVLF